MSAQDIEIARQNLTTALGPVAGSSAHPVMLAVEDLIRAYLVNHVQHAAHQAAMRPLGQRLSVLGSPE